MSQKTMLTPFSVFLKLKFRIITSHKPDFFLSRKHYFDSYNRAFEIPLDNIDDEDDFDSLFKLQAGCKTDSQYKILKSGHAYYLSCLLKKMGYFSDNSPESFDEEHQVVARFLEHMLKVADDNCHEICEMDTPR